LFDKCSSKSLSVCGAVVMLAPALTRGFVLPVPERVEVPDSPAYQAGETYLLELQRDKLTRKHQYSTPDYGTVSVREGKVYSNLGKWAGFAPGTSYSAVTATFEEVAGRVPAPAPASPAPVPAPVAVEPSPPTSAEPTLDLNALEQRLRDTRAIGVFTKLSLKNQVDDLLDALRGYYKAGNSAPGADLRQRYDLLIMKVLTLLQDGDPALASSLSSSREAIWGILADPVKFEKI
jgi:hypothetical protein